MPLSLFCDVVLPPAEVAVDAHQLAVVGEGVRMALHDLQKGGDLPQIDDGDDHAAFAVGIHPA